MLSPSFGTSSSGGSGRGFSPSQKKKVNPVQGHFDAYGTSMKGQGDDYTDIMNRFRDIYNNPAGGAGGSNINLQHDVTIPTYQESPEYKRAIGNLGDLSATGGYSAGDIANLRARAVSPVRSIYGNATRNLERQRSLQGGYSPNFSASTVKMARDMSGQMSSALTDANAGIAQNVAQNRIATASPYASITAGENARRNEFEQRNADTKNRYGFENMENRMRQFQFPQQMKLSALQGMTGLYGTTPATSALTQRGALSMAELQNQINQQNKTHNINRIRPFGGS